MRTTIPSDTESSLLYAFLTSYGGSFTSQGGEHLLFQLEEIMQDLTEIKAN